MTPNEDKRPFSRDQRTWIYASAKEENNHFGFGTEADVEHVQAHASLKQRTFADTLPDPHDPQAPLPSANVLGGPRGRAKAFRPASVVNVSAMSFGSICGRRHHSAQQGGGAGGHDAQHGRGRSLAVPPQRRRPPPSGLVIHAEPDRANSKKPQQPSRCAGGTVAEPVSFRATAIHVSRRSDLSAGVEVQVLSANCPIGEFTRDVEMPNVSRVIPGAVEQDPDQRRAIFFRGDQAAHDPTRRHLAATIHWRHMV